MAATAIRVQALDGVWETLGVDRLVGITPEQVRPSSDQGGPSAFSFSIQRDPDSPQIDLLSWTPCEIDVGNILVWEGRIRETPGTHGTGRLIAVSAEGWQAHLDDDSVERTWLIGDLTRWQDTRQQVSTNLAIFQVAPQVAASSHGTLTISLAAGTPIAATPMAAGITFDLGPSTDAVQACLFDLVCSTTDARLQLYCRTSSNPDPTGPGASSDTADSGANLAAASTVNRGGVFPSPQRYVHIFIYLDNHIAAFTPAADITLTIARAQVATTAGHISFNPAVLPNASTGVSDLRASDIVLTAGVDGAPQLTFEAGSPAYADEIEGDGPQSHWRVGNQPPPDGVQTSGGYPNTADLGLLNNPILAFGSGCAPAPSLLADDTDLAASYDGSANAWADIGNPNAYQWPAQTIEATCRPDAVALSQVVRFENRMALRLASGAIEITIWISGGTRGSPPAGVNRWVTAPFLAAGTIYHLIAMYDGQRAFLLVNGVPITVTQFTDSGFGTGPLGIAIDANVGSTYVHDENFQGVIDDIAIYHYVLSPNQQINHYQAARARLYGGVKRSQFKIPTYAPTGAQTTRTHLAAVNALHGWRAKVLPGRKMLFAPQETLVRLQAADTVQFVEGGSNTTDQQFNRVAVEGVDATGAAVRATVTAGQAIAAAPVVDAGVAFPNPGFESSLTGWTFTPTTGAPTWTRNTSLTHSGGGSGLLNLPGPAGATVASHLPSGGRLVRGLTYVVTLWYFIYTDPASQNLDLTIAFGTDADQLQVTYWPASRTVLTSRDGHHTRAASTHGNYPVINQWVRQRFVWAPARTVPTEQAYVSIAAGISDASAAAIAFDDLAIGRLAPTLLDRRGFVRTKVLSAQSSIDPATANALAAIYLRSVAGTPFRGSFTAGIMGDVLSATGVPMHPAELLLHTGELIRLPVENPVTGDIGRDGKIATVSYDADLDSSTVQIDDDRTNFDVFLARMAIMHTAAGA